MPRTYKKKPPRYTDQTVKKALEDIKDGHSIRKVSETHGISTGTLVRLKRRDRDMLIRYQHVCHHSMPQAVARIQSLAPSGMKYQLSLVPKEEEISIASVLLARGKSVPSGPQKRRSAISNYAEVITSEETMERLEEKDKKEKEQDRYARAT